MTYLLTQTYSVLSQKGKTLWTGEGRVDGGSLYTYLMDPIPFTVGDWLVSAEFGGLPVWERPFWEITGIRQHGFGKFESFSIRPISPRVRKQKVPMSYISEALWIVVENMERMPHNTSIESAFRQLAEELERAEAGLDSKPYVVINEGRPLRITPVDKMFFDASRVYFDPRPGTEQDERKYNQ